MSREVSVGVRLQKKGRKRFETRNTKRWLPGRHVREVHKGRDDDSDPAFAALAREEKEKMHEESGNDWQHVRHNMWFGCI